MEKVTRFIMAKDHPSEEFPGTDEFHVSIWFTDEEGESRHRRKSFAGTSSLADILADMPNYLEWAE